ncbi:MAG: two-component regulator propeller domain-containing protein [Pseudomonadota bacterium]
MSEPSHKIWSRWGARSLRSLLLGWLLVCGSAALADGVAGAPMRFANLDTEDGLAQNSVTAMVQDGLGFLWFGTENGLNRYDGTRFLHFQADPRNPSSLPADYVTDLVVTPNGALWVATEGGGIARWDAEQGGFSSVGIADGLSDLRVSSMALDASGALWVGTLRHGLNRYDPTSGTVTVWRHDEANVDSLSHDAIHALHVDSVGTLWIGTNAGLDRFDAATGTVQRVAGDETLGGERVRTIWRDSAGALWVGTQDGGLSRTDDGGQTFRNYQSGNAYGSLSNNRVEAVLEDSQQRLWIATADGLNRFIPSIDGFSVHRYSASDPKSLADSNTISLFQDSGGLLWVGTKTAGVSKWNPRSWSFGHILPSLVAGNEELIRRATSFAEARDGELWFGSFGAGLAKVDSLGTVTDRVWSGGPDGSRIDDDRVMALIRQGDLLWIGTMSGGLSRFNLDTGDVRTYRASADIEGSVASDGIMSLYVDQDGTLWVGTFGGGVDRFDAKNERFTNFRHDPEDPTSLSNSRATAMVSDRSGRLWVGTAGGGLNRRAGRGLAWEHVDLSVESSAASSVTVSALHLDAKGRLWVGTREGLYRFDRPNQPIESLTYRRYDTLSGLADDSIYGIRSDAANRVWLSTNRGLSVLDPHTDEIVNHSISDGLQGAEFNFGAHYMLADGRLAFGGANGFNLFDPMRLAINTVPPAVALTGLDLLNQPIREDGVYDQVDSLELSHEDDVVTFEFAALDFAAPSENQFAYKLEGFDRSWVEAGNERRTTYTNLSGGEYVFRVRAANSDGIWSETDLSLTLDVNPPPWLTPWAYVMYVLGVFGVLFLIWNAQARKLRQRAEYSRQLEAEVAERTEEIASRNRELELANEKLHEASYTDPLTGLRNRRYFFDQISAELDRTAGTSQPSRQSAFILMMIDLDHFKPVNDTYGHQAGDRLLVGVADSLTQLCRSGDTVIRWGGDEFMLVARLANADEADELAERVRSAVASSVFPVGRGQLARTTSSIGYAPFPLYAQAPTLVDWEQTLKVADLLMYRSKARRNSWCGGVGLQAPDSADALLRVLEMSIDDAADEGLLRVTESQRDAAERIA